MIKDYLVYTLLAKASMSTYLHQYLNPMDFEIPYLCS